ncbi:MAG: hypothetical protein ABWY36_05410 [Leifsonia sp.]
MSTSWSGITIYSETLTVDELRGMWHEYLAKDYLWEQEVGCSDDWNHAADRRLLYVQGHHGSWWANEMEHVHHVEGASGTTTAQYDGAIARLLELRSDVTEIRWRREASDSNWEEALAACIYTRDGRQPYGAILVPVDIDDRIAEVRSLVAQAAATSVMPSMLRAGALSKALAIFNIIDKGKAL